MHKPSLTTIAAYARVAALAVTAAAALLQSRAHKRGARLEHQDITHAATAAAGTLELLDHGHQEISS